MKFTSKDQQAFPLAASEEQVRYHGMSLRDYFAAKIIQTLLAEEDAMIDDCVEMSYEIADRMLKEREK